MSSVIHAGVIERLFFKFTTVLPIIRKNYRHPIVKTVKYIFVKSNLVIISPKKSWTEIEKFKLIFKNILLLT